MCDEDFEYCGDCCTCGKAVDHSDAGFCRDCNGVFCWSECGTWFGAHHRCNACGAEFDKEAN